MDLLLQAGVSVVAVAICFFSFLLAFRSGYFNWSDWLQTEVVAQLKEQIRKQEIELDYQSKQNRKLTKELLDESRKSDALEKRIIELEKRILDLEKEKGTRVGMKVLGIWPQRPQDTPLDLEGNRDAIYDAGFEFVPLFAEHANRQEILHHLRKGEVSILEIGGHGDGDGVPLADGLARAGWWEQILRGRAHVRIVMFLTCFSDQSMFDAMHRAGIPHIITVNGEIEDAAAINFAQAFYSNYANGLSVAAAVREAKLILDYTQAAKIELSKTIKEG